jgi:hypothetical protein
MEITNTVSYLNTVFGFATTVLNAPATRRHRTGPGSWGPSYKPPKQRPIKDKPKYSPVETKVLRIAIGMRKGVTGEVIAKKLKITRNHAQICLCKFFKEGKLKRVQRKVPHIRFYEYYLPEVTVD